MRIAFVILMFFINNGVFAQARTKDIDTAVLALDKALLSGDTVSLKILLDDDITYGHSNGWLESKHDVIADLYNGKLVYRQIKASEQKTERNGIVAVVRMKADVDVAVNGTPVQLKLSILQVWKIQHRHWQLIARQSVKI